MSVFNLPDIQLFSPASRYEFVCLEFGGGQVAYSCFIATILLKTEIGSIRAVGLVKVQASRNS